MAYETNPLLALWYALPPNVRQQYTSGLKAAGELSPGAAVRDVVDESGNMVKAAQSGNWVDAAAGPAKMTVAALGAIPFSKAGRMTAKTAQDTLAPIRGYHASPYNFDKFELRPGTGEGSAAYGHGLYVAENEAVSNRYHQLFKEMMKGGFKPGAHRYEVNLHADPKQFLDWDKPLREMSPEVQERLHKEWLAHKDDHAHQTGGQIYESSRIVPGDYRDPAAASAALKEAGIPGIKYLDQGSRGWTVHNTYKGEPYGDPLKFPTQQQAAAYAAEQEAKGFGARVAQEGTSNYVVFDPAIIEILRKYGMLPATVAAGATGAATVPGLLAPPDNKGAY